MSAQGRFLPLSVLAIGAGAAIGWLLREPPAAPQPSPAAQSQPAAPSPPPALLQGEVKSEPKPEPPAPKPATARFSTGVEVALLNGVKDPLDLPWPPDRAWSPIAETVHDHRGIDWYHHADGSWSTTVMRMDTAKGHDVAVGLVFTDAGPAVSTKVGSAGLEPPAK